MAQSGKEAYEEQRAKKLSQLEDQIYGLVDKYEIDDLDSIIIRNLPNTTSRLRNLLTAESKEKLDSMLHGEISWIPLKRLNIYDSSVDIGKMFEKFGKIPSEEYRYIMDDIMG